MRFTELPSLEKNRTTPIGFVVPSTYTTKNDVTYLLTAASKGQLDTVKQRLAQKPALFHASGHLIDITGQPYTDITVFHYAFMAGDIGVCAPCFWNDSVCPKRGWHSNYTAM